MSSSGVIAQAIRVLKVVSVFFRVGAVGWWSYQAVNVAVGQYRVVPTVPSGLDSSTADGLGALARPVAVLLKWVHIAADALDYWPPAPFVLGALVVAVWLGLDWFGRRGRIVSSLGVASTASAWYHAVGFNPEGVTLNLRLAKVVSTEFLTRQRDNFVRLYSSEMNSRDNLPASVRDAFVERVVPPSDYSLLSWSYDEMVSAAVDLAGCHADTYVPVLETPPFVYPPPCVVVVTLAVVALVLWCWFGGTPSGSTPQPPVVDLDSVNTAIQRLSDQTSAVETGLSDLAGQVAKLSVLVDSQFAAVDKTVKFNTQSVRVVNSTLYGVNMKFDCLNNMVQTHSEMIWNTLKHVERVARRMGVAP